MASKSGVLYTGVTNNLERRVHEHKTSVNDGFTKRYKVHKLVYFEGDGDICSAIEREKEIKGWSRKKKEALINEMNPSWRDLSLEWDSFW